MPTSTLAPACATCGEHPALAGRPDCFGCMRSRGITSPALRRLALFDLALQHPDAFAVALAVAEPEVDRAGRTRSAAEVAARTVVDSLPERVEYARTRAAVQAEHEASLGRCWRA